MRRAAEVAAGIAARERRALARLLSWLEANDPRGDAVMAVLRVERRPVTVGITGSPGAGKSTLTSSIVGRLRARGHTVAVLAVDPSSPYSGGALLGDRIRMTEHTHDEGVFVRSMATRGQLGGLAPTASAALQALECFGFDWVLVETVGVGQADVEIASQADTTIVVVNPGWGDDVQASKAGLLEVADIFAVNKSDRPNAATTVNELRGALDLGPDRGWKVPVIPCVAIEAGGTSDLVEALDEHRMHLEQTGELDRRRAGRRVRDLRLAVEQSLVRQAELILHAAEWQSLIVEVEAGHTQPRRAATIILEGARSGPHFPSDGL